MCDYHILLTFPHSARPSTILLVVSICIHLEEGGSHHTIPFCLPPTHTFPHKGDIAHSYTFQILFYSHLGDYLPDPAHCCACLCTLLLYACQLTYYSPLTCPCNLGGRPFILETRWGSYSCPLPTVTISISLGGEVGRDPLFDSF